MKIKFNLILMTLFFGGNLSALTIHLEIKDKKSKDEIFLDTYINVSKIYDKNFNEKFDCTKNKITKNLKNQEFIDICLRGTIADFDGSASLDLTKFGTKYNYQIKVESYGYFTRYFKVNNQSGKDIFKTVLMYKNKRIQQEIKLKNEQIEKNYALYERIINNKLTKLESDKLKKLKEIVKVNGAEQGFFKKYDSDNQFAKWIHENFEDPYIYSILEKYLAEVIWDNI